MAQLLSNLPVGAKVKFGKHQVNTEVAQNIEWLVVAKNHSGYPDNSVTLLTEKAIDMRAFDGKEYSASNAFRKASGWANYKYSNIRQWLNTDEEGSAWYQTTHSLDTPPSNYNVLNDTGYDTRPGFLYFFSSEERDAILPTTLKTYSFDTKTTESVTDKIYLLSYREVSGSTDSTLLDEGTQLEYFVGMTDFRSGVTTQAYSNSLSTNKPSTVSSYILWWSRSEYYDSVNNSIYSMSVNNTASAFQYTIIEPYTGKVGVRPALNLSSTTKVSDSVDTDGCYMVVYNSAPPAPTTIATPTTIYGEKSNSISWSSVADPDGDSVTYQLECSIDGGDYTLVYSGASTSYAHLVPFGTTSVAYRVKATDPSGESSEYTNSATMAVINNNAPVISGADANLGVKSEGFTGTYTITDANSDAVTVTEAIDGIQIRALVATLGSTIAYGVTENTWLALPNGSHTLTISATDGIDTTVRRYTFTKLVDSFTIQNSTPWQSANMPSRIMVVVTKNIPSTATFKVEVCNNGYDTSPTWEDATDAVVSGLVHVFANKTKTATNWGVKFRVTVERNGAAGACYVSAIGGNFE